MSIYKELGDALTPQGFILRGGFRLNTEDKESLGKANTLVMIGNGGAAFWRHFDEERPDLSNPMDHWTGQTLSGFADIFGARAIYPFEGPPYYPFQQWAQRCEPVYPSPIGPLIHPKFGLWHAYRCVFLFDEEFDVPALESTPSPCDICLEKACLNACPAGVFDNGGYDVPACTTHLKASEGTDCMGFGCVARRACPIGQKFTYAPEQAQFHMEKFLESNG